MKQKSHTTSRFGLILLVLGAAATASAGTDDPLYVLKPSLAVDEHGNGHATLDIKAKQGYKWNKEFPSKLVIDSQKGAALTKQKFVKSDVRTADKGKNATFDLGPAGKVGPNAVIHGKVSFSLCTKKMCKVFMNREVTFKVSDQ
ncbi:MAG: hypothetical protein GXP54_07620 [Deltaproteobacteria bacterium]|nr:hypothetical protein [Deltaproteobacteria bacterium]